MLSAVRRETYPGIDRQSVLPTLKRCLYAHEGRLPVAQFQCPKAVAAQSPACDWCAGGLELRAVSYPYRRILARCERH